MTEVDEYGDWLTLDVYDPDGRRIGQIADLYDDDAGTAGEPPAMAAVRTGRLGMRSSYLPLRGVASRTADGVSVPYDREQVRSAPEVAEGDELTEDEVEEVYRHYDYQPADGPRAPGRWRTVLRRRVVVTVVEEVRDPAALAEVLPEGIPAEEVRALAEAPGPVVIVHEREVERLLEPGAGGPGTAQPGTAEPA